MRGPVQRLWRSEAAIHESDVTGTAPGDAWDACSPILGELRWLMGSGMRRVVPFGLLTLVLSACASASGGLDERTVTPTALEAAAIRLGEQSNVCVAVHVDPRVWPRPVTPETARNLSGDLASELRRLFEQRGGSAFLPGPRRSDRPGPWREPRFIADPDRNDPICRDDGEDVLVTASYRPRSDGTPFLFDYRIEQGSAVRSGSAERDIFGEIRRGEVRVLNLDEPVQAVLGNDLRDRAEGILNVINPR